MVGISSRLSKRKDLVGVLVSTDIFALQQRYNRAVVLAYTINPFSITNDETRRCDWSKNVDAMLELLAPILLNTFMIT